MTNLVGRVRFTATLDGRGTERDAESIGRKAGAASGEGYDKEWNKRFEDSLTSSAKSAVTKMRKAGDDSGKSFGGEFTKSVKSRLDAFVKDAQKSFDGLRIDKDFLDNFSKGFDDAGLAAGRLQEQIQTLNDQNLITERQYESARQKISDWADAQRDAAAETNRSIEAQEREAAIIARFNTRMAEHARSREALNRITREQNRIVLENSSVWREQDDHFANLRRRMDAVISSSSDLNFQWSDLSHNGRQWTLIIGAILAGMEELAVLSSAAGGGLIAIGGAATSGIVGIGGLVAVIKTLTKDVDELPESMRAVVTEGKEFAGVFEDIRNVIAGSAFEQMEGVFTRLEGNVRSLAPEFAELGTSIGLLFGDLERNTRPGTEALEEIRESLRLAGPNFQELAGSAGTFGVAFLRAFNRAQPLVEGLTDYVERLATQFDRFTRSNGFNVWMANSQTVLTSFSGLLDQTARSLNNLVTPDTAARTAEFLDDLTDFMPNFEQFLRTLGNLNIFGIIAQGLSDIGTGLSPLAPAFQDLAAQIDRIAQIALSQFGDALETVAAALAPVVQGFADFLEAIPDDVFAGLVNGALLLGGAFLLLKGASGIAGALSALDNWSLGVKNATGITGRLDGAVGGLGRALGGLARGGIIIGAIAALDGAFDQLFESMNNIEVKSQDLVASSGSLEQAYDQLSSSVFTGFEQIDMALEGLERRSNQGGWFASGPLQELDDVLKRLDPSLAALAQKSLPEAQERFAAWVQEIGASREQAGLLLEQMSGTRAVFAEAAAGADGTATSAEILAVALGEVSGEFNRAKSSTEDNIDVLALLDEKAQATQETIDGLAERIRGFGEATLNTRSAQREFEAALDDLTGSIAENGTELRVSEEAGRANLAAIDDLAQATLDLAGTTVEQTGKQADANAVIQEGRDRLIEMLAQFGITGAEAEAYADQLGLIPEDVTTAAELTGVAEAERQLEQLARNRTAYISAVVTNSAGNDFFQNGGPNRPGFARGTTVYGPTEALIGEAGPEAVVPLNRPLDQVEPGLPRWLSAIAQGKAMPSFAGGGVVGASRNQTLEAGAIVIQGDPQPEVTANAVVRRLFEQVGG